MQEKSYSHLSQLYLVAKAKARAAASDCLQSPGRLAEILFVMSHVKKRATQTQQKMELVILNDLVPKDHLVRKIDCAIEFDFIYEKVNACLPGKNITKLG